MCCVALGCGTKNTDSSAALDGAAQSGAGRICAGYWLDDIDLDPEVDFWALRTPDAPAGQERTDEWSRGEACRAASDEAACQRSLSETWEMNRGWGYQGASDLSFMVTTRGDTVERYDSNGALMGLFGDLDQPEEVLFYAGVLGYIPRCQTLARTDDGRWELEAKVVTSECPHVIQRQIVAISDGGTLHTLDVLQVEHSADCER
jgi:hypothetical protein